MAALKHQIEARKIPGMRDFFNEIYADGSTSRHPAAT